MLSKAGFHNPAREGYCSNTWVLLVSLLWAGGCVLFLLSLLLITCGLYERNIKRYYTKLKAANRARAWPLLSFHQKQLCPSISLFILASSSPPATALSPAVLHWSLLTQNTSLCQGKTTSLLPHSWHWRLTLAFCPQNTSPIALSRQLAKRNKI